MYRLVDDRAIKMDSKQAPRPRKRCDPVIIQMTIPEWASLIRRLNQLESQVTEEYQASTICQIRHELQARRADFGARVFLGRIELSPGK
jgi:hypothetical protein